MEGKSGSVTGSTTPPSKGLPPLPSPLLSLRLTHLDFYSQPLHTFSPSTPFLAARLTTVTPVASAISSPSVPVIRIFGVTPAGQKCCAHIHGARPYLHVVVPGLSHEGLFSYAAALKKALHALLATAFPPAQKPTTDTNAVPAMPKEQTGEAGEHAVPLIDDIVPVSAKPIYGYSIKKQVFLKVTTFTPATVSRLSSLLTQTTLPAPFDTLTAWPPHSAHIPFTLQFLTDNSLSGMDFVHFNTLTFRPPLPISTSSKAALNKLHEPPTRRMFLQPLPSLFPTLVAPFPVPKRSSVPVEFDAFVSDIVPPHVVTVGKGAIPDQYRFVCSTLATLWSEEKLRIGVWPPRLPPAERHVQAGANLSDPRLKQKLVQLIKEDRRARQQQTENINEHQERGSDVDLGSIEHWLDSSPTQRVGAPLSFSEEHLSEAVRSVTQRLSAGSLLQPQENSYASQEADEVDKHGDENEGVHPEAAGDSDDDGPSVEQTWEDIASCTQRPVVKSKLKDVETKEGQSLDAVNPHELIEANSAQPGGTQEKLPPSLPSSLPRQESIQATPQGLRSSPPVFTSNDDLLRTPRGPRRRFPNHPPTSLSLSSPSTAFYIRPATRPPSVNDILTEEMNEPLHIGLPMEWPTPFYSAERDQLAASRRFVFAGRLIRVRLAGALGLPDFPSLFDIQQQPVQTLTTYISPTIKPPTLAQLRAALPNKLRLRGADGNQTVVAPGGIDSAGRRKIEGKPRSSQPFGSLSQFQSNSQHGDLAGNSFQGGSCPEAELSQEQIADMLFSNEAGGSDLKTEIGNPGGKEIVVSRQPPEPYPRRSMSPLSNFPKFKTQLEQSLDHFADASSGHQKSQHDLDDDGDEDDAVLLEYHRPLSPKYDETFQLHVKHVIPSVALSKPRVTNKPSSPHDAGESEQLPRNSTLSLSVSPHRHQKIGVMSIEVLSQSYAEKLPDPAKNEILAVVTVEQHDEQGEDEFQPQSTCQVFTTKTTSQLSSFFDVRTFHSEVALLDGLALHIRAEDPDVIVGFETQKSSVGILLERANVISHSFAQSASRWLKGPGTMRSNPGTEAASNNLNNNPAAAYYHRKGADIKVTGRHILSLWRLVRTEVKLSAYSRETVAAELFTTTFPRYTNRCLEDWFIGKHPLRAVRHIARQAFLNVAIVNKLNILSRTGELARVYGVDFMSVLTRGSQYRVESMMRRMAIARGYLLLTASREQVFRQPAVEALPLVMEPESALYVDPVIVLDFQSLYPSVIIAHNLCFSTMLGNINRISSWNQERRVGVLPNYIPPAVNEWDSEPSEHIFIASNGEMFVDASVRRGILPQLLDEILETRIMVKSAMKGVLADDATLSMLNARQFGLKMIANVTYGYTAASFSGRMPCAGLADAIVQSGRDALERITQFVDNELSETHGTRVVYGDTDSLFVQVPGATREEAFRVGQMIVKQAEEMFPHPMALKLEKVYQPCILQTKKRYVGYSYESPSQAVPIFDAKGIETVRRDSCPLVQKTLERTLRTLFETKDLSQVRRLVRNICVRLHKDRVPFSDYIFRKEVRLGSYKEGHLPPAAIVATRAIECDARAAPRQGERVAFVVTYDRPGAPLKDCVQSPEEFLRASQQGDTRLNTTYYITKQLLPTLDRVLTLVGARAAIWYGDMPQVSFPVVRSRVALPRSGGQSRMPQFYTSASCVLCHSRSVTGVCSKCVGQTEFGLSAARFMLQGRLRSFEEAVERYLKKCRACGGLGRLDAAACLNVECGVFWSIGRARVELDRVAAVLNEDGTWDHGGHIASTGGRKRARERG